MINHRKTVFGLAVIAVAAGVPVGTASANWGRLVPAQAPSTPRPPAPPPPPAAPGNPTPAAPAAAPGAPPASPPAPAPVMPPGALPPGVKPPAPPSMDESVVPPGEDAGPGTKQDGPPTDDASRTNFTVPTQPDMHGAARTSEGLPPLVFPSLSATRKKRVKPLQTGLSLPPSAPDFGGETDLVSTANDAAIVVKPKRWTYSLSGFLRAPLRIGYGSTPTVMGDVVSYDRQTLHSPAFVVGANNRNWDFTGLSPTPLASLYLSVGNALVTGTVIIAANTFFDASYRKVNEMGAISQAYVTMKWADLFGERGGLAWTVGAFSNRYGLAGPRQQSSGYYNTYLFGRTRVAGEALTLNIDITPRLELIVEHGFGAKVEVVPFLINSDLSGAPYLPDQGPTAQGSNFVHHAHAAVLYDDWLRVAGHYMTSWSPNDLSTTAGISGRLRSSQMNVFGGDVHLDSRRFGNAYVGFSRIDATRVISLADGIEVLHAENGLGLTQNYLNPAYKYTAGETPTGAMPVTPPAPGAVGDNGKIDSVLFQYMVRAAPLLGLPLTGRDLSLAIFGMFNHVNAQANKQDKLKFGAEAQFAAWKWLSAGVRFDRVMPDGGNADVAYSALSPRLIIHTSWLSREYIMLSYSRYFLGDDVVLPPKFIYETIVRQPDKNLFVLSALITF